MSLTPGSLVRGCSFVPLQPCTYTLFTPSVWTAGTPYCLHSPCEWWGLKSPEGTEWADSFWMHVGKKTLITFRSIILSNLESTIIHIRHLQVRYITYGLVFTISNQSSHPALLSCDPSVPSPSPSALPWHYFLLGSFYIWTCSSLDFEWKSTIPWDPKN